MNIIKNFNQYINSLPASENLNESNDVAFLIKRYEVEILKANKHDSPEFPDAKKLINFLKTTISNKYLEWLVKIYTNKEFTIQKDLDYIKEAVKRFEKNCKLLPNNKQNIIDCTLKDFKALLEECSVPEIQEKLLRKKEAEVIYDNGGLYIVKVITRDAVVHFGPMDKIAWCIRNQKSSQIWDMYGGSEIYYININSNDNDWYCIVMSSKQPRLNTITNIDNELGYDATDLLKKYPKIREIFAAKAKLHDLLPLLPEDTIKSEKDKFIEIVSSLTKYKFYSTDNVHGLSNNIYFKYHLSFVYHGIISVCDDVTIFCTNEGEVFEKMVNPHTNKITSKLQDVREFVSKDKKLIKLLTKNDLYSLVSKDLNTRREIFLQNYVQQDVSKRTVKFSWLEIPKYIKGISNVNPLIIPLSANDCGGVLTKINDEYLVLIFDKSHVGIAIGDKYVDILKFLKTNPDFEPKLKEIWRTYSLRRVVTDSKYGDLFLI